MADKKEKKKDKKTDDQVVEYEQQIGELTETLQRLQAEFENYQKRVDRDLKDKCEFASKDIIEKILPILDNFELSLKNTDDKEQFVKGMELIYSQLNDMLAKEGLQPIKATGTQFNPELHEAMLVEESDEKDNTVIEELQKGYTLNEKVIRTAKVKISKK